MERTRSAGQIKAPAGASPLQALAIMEDQNKANRRFLIILTLLMCAGGYAAIDLIRILLTH